MANRSRFDKYYAPALITGAFGILMTILTLIFSSNKSKLITKETTETRSPDGTITKRQTENYR